VRVARLTIEADRDLDQIWVYIAENNFDAADRVGKEIQAEIQKLAAQPGMGHWHAELRDATHRVWKINSYLIIYRFDDAELVVLRVIHGARDIGSMIR
jgi:toxin ParE1/3/4